MVTVLSAQNPNLLLSCMSPCSPICMTILARSDFQCNTQSVSCRPVWHSPNPWTFQLFQFQFPGSFRAWMQNRQWKPGPFWQRHYGQPLFPKTHPQQDIFLVQDVSCFFCFCILSACSPPVFLGAGYFGQSSTHTGVAVLPTWRRQAKRVHGDGVSTSIFKNSDTLILFCINCIAIDRIRFRGWRFGPQLYKAWCDRCVNKMTWWCRTDWTDRLKCPWQVKKQKTGP